MATKTLAPAGGNWTVGSSWVGGVAPLASDDVVIDGTSGNVVIDSGAVCRSADFNGYSGLCIHNANVTLNIGDGTAGTGNRALRMSPTMTYLKMHPQTSAIAFISTSATVQTIDWADQLYGNTTYNASSGGSWIWNDAFYSSFVGLNATLTLTKGTLNTNSQTMWGGQVTGSNSNVRRLIMGSSQFHLNGAGNNCWLFATITNLTVDANTAKVFMYRSLTNFAPLVQSGTKDWVGLDLEWIGGGICTIASGGTPIFDNFTVNGGIDLGDGREDRLQMNNNWTATGNVVFNGFSATRRLRVHSNGGVRSVGVASGSSVTGKYVDFQNTSLSVSNDLSAIEGGAGDLGNNTNIGFTTGITKYFYAPTTGVKNYNDSSYWFTATGGGGSPTPAPLPQDDARFDSNSFPVTGITVRNGVGAERLGKNVDWTGVTNNPTWDFQVDVINFGSMTFDPNMDVTSYADAFFTMFGSGASQFYTVDFAGLQLPHSVFLINFAATNTCTLQSHFIGNASNTTLFQVTGLIDFNGKNITAGRFQQSSGTITMGTSIYTLKGVGTIWNCAGTVNAGTSEIIIDSQNATAKTFAGGGKVYNKLTLQGNYNDTITFSGNNTFGVTVNTKTSAFALLYTAGSTTIFSSTYTKTAGALWTLGSTTTSIFTWSKASGSIVFVDAIISKSTASGGATFTANTDSIDGGGNTGWSGFVTDDFTWTNGDADNDYNNPLNWYGGNVPTSTDRAIFSAVSVANCTVPDGIAFSVKGFLITAGYTGSITSLGDQNMSFGSDGIDINGGTLVATGNPVVDGTVRMANGVLNLSTAAFTVLSQGSTKPTISITGGTLTHNNNTIYIESGVGEAIVSTISTRPFGNLVFLDPLTYSGTSFVDLTFTIGSGITFNADVSVKGDVAATITSGTGTIRLIGTTTQAVGASTIPNLQINGSSTITLGGNVTVDSTLTITAVNTINGFSLICKGNIVSADSVIAGTTNTSIEGTNFEQAISGAGILIGDVTINKSNGVVKLNSNMNITDIGKNFTVTQGMFNTNEFNVVFGNNLTVTEVTGGLYVETSNSSTQVNGTLTGRKLERQKLYAGITTI